MRIEFNGASDDLVEISGAKMLNGMDAGHTEAEVGTSDGVFSIIGTESLACKECGQPTHQQTKALLKVWGAHTACGWLFSAFQDDEGQQVPDGWTITLEHAHEYSMKLVVDTGDQQVAVRIEEVVEED